MFLRVKTVKSNPYFYLVENERVEGKPNPIQQVVEYLGNRSTAIAILEASDYPGKDKLLARVRAAAPATGPNNGRRGRPRKAAGMVGDDHAPYHLIAVLTIFNGEFRGVDRGVVRAALRLKIRYAGEK